MVKKVLLVEDEPNIVEALSYLFLRDGWQVLAHPEGETAAEKAIQIKPNVIVLDVMLPNKSGFDVISDIRQSSETAKTPILMLTARGQTKDRELALARGATEFMTKPFSNAEVIQVVNDLAENSK